MFNNIIRLQKIRFIVKLLTLHSHKWWSLAGNNEGNRYRDTYPRGNQSVMVERLDNIYPKIQPLIMRRSTPLQQSMTCSISKPLRLQKHRKKSAMYLQLFQKKILVFLLENAEELTTLRKLNFDKTIVIQDTCTQKHLNKQKSCSKNI